MSQKRTFQQLDSSENSERPISKQKVDEEVKTDERADNIEVNYEKQQTANTSELNFNIFTNIHSLITAVNLDNKGKENIFETIENAYKIIEIENNNKILKIIRQLECDLRQKILKHIASGNQKKEITLNYTYKFPVENLIKTVNQAINKIEYFHGINIVACAVYNEETKIRYAITW